MALLTTKERVSRLYKVTYRDLIITLTWKDLIFVWMKSYMIM